jgi:hypothetical protein
MLMKILNSKSVLIAKFIFVIFVLLSWFITARFATSSYTLEAYVNNPLNCFLGDDITCLKNHQQENEINEIACVANSPTSTFDDFYKINAENFAKLPTLKCTVITNNLSSTFTSTQPNSAVDTDKKGQFGDTFGALTSLFTIFAFLFVVAGYLQQKSILESTKTEYENNTHTRLVTEYWKFVEDATNTYRKAIESITYFDDKRNFTLYGRNALFSIWRVHMHPADTDDKPLQKFDVLNMKFGLGNKEFLLFDPLLSKGQVPKGIKPKEWHTFPRTTIYNPVYEVPIERLILDVIQEWHILYEENRYYLDPVFNSLNHLYNVINIKAPTKNQDQIKKDALTQFFSGLNTLEITFMLAKLNDGTDNKWANLLNDTESSILFNTYDPGMDPIAILYLWKWKRKLPK